MIWGFVIIVLLTGLLLIPNALYAFRQFLTNRNLVWLSVYFFFLLALGYLVLHLATRTVQIVQTAKEVLAEPDIEAVRLGP
jgi:uncharacterized membrane protein